jgi:hypothetical protein
MVVKPVQLFLLDPAGNYWLPAGYGEEYLNDTKNPLIYHQKKCGF